MLVMRTMHSHVGYAHYKVLVGCADFYFPECGWDSAEEAVARGWLDGAGQATEWKTWIDSTGSGQ